MLRKKIKQFFMAVKSPQQATRIALSELKMRLHLPTLRSLELQVTHFCNMNCPFCYAKDIMTTKKKEQIPLENIQQIIKGCYALGMIHVNITGGEPLIRKDIVELVDCIPKDVVVSLVTNSVLLTRQKTDELINAGLSTIQMSFGSNYPGFNLDLAKYCVKKRLAVTLSIVNTKEERKNNIKAIQIAKENGFSVLFNYPMRYKNSGLDSEFYWENRAAPLVREDNFFWSGKNTCPAGVHKIYITNDGDIMPCDRIHQIYGNVYQDSIKTVWKKMLVDFKNRQSFCLLETDKEQWLINNKKSRKNHPFKNMGASKNAFNVLDE